MSKSKLPNVLHDPDFPNEAHLNLEDGNTITVGTNAWFGWLEEHSSFHFDSGKDFFTALKRKYDTGDYWYASRKTGGKTQNKYLGKSEMLTLERMRAIASKLSQPLQPKENGNVQLDVQPQAVSVIQPDVQPKQVQELEEKLARVTSQADQLAVELEQERSQLEEQKRVEQVLRKGRKQLEQELEEANQKIERLQLQCQQLRSVKDSQGKQQQDIERLQEALKEAGAMADQFHREAELLKDERDSLSSQLNDQATKAGKWYDLAKEAEKLAEDGQQEIERLRTQSQSRPAVDPDLIALLQNAITPIKKGGSYDARNATGLKRLVEQVLAVLSSG